MFTISIFRSPQHFIGLFISLFEFPIKSTNELKILLTRTKNPPLSIIYTFNLLCSNNDALSITRFISQLSDLSEGVSMSSSLSFLLSDSSLLTQMRHMITHGQMPSEQMISIGRNIILKEIQQKFWKFKVKEYGQFYDIDWNIVEKQYRRIYQQKEDNQQQFQNNMRTKIQTIKKSIKTNIFQISQIDKITDYKFKQIISSLILTIATNQQPHYQQLDPFAPSIKYQNQIIDNLKQIYKNSSALRKKIIFLRLISVLIKYPSSQCLIEIIQNIFTNISDELLQDNLISKEFLKIYFVRYVGKLSRVIELLPANKLESIRQQWMKIQQKGLKKKIQIQNL